jgi:putative ABC transport system permease protein
VLRIVGIVPNSTALAKIPNIFLSTKGLQYQRPTDG